MVPTLIVLFLVALGVAIVAWAVRRRPARPYAQRLEQDTAWNDPTSITPAPPIQEDGAPDPFAHAPLPRPEETSPPGETPR